jgi:hypothetical protein
VNFTGGTIDVQAGALDFTGGGKLGEPSFISSNGGGTARLNGGTLTLNDTTTVSTLTFLSGTVTGVGQFNVTGGLTWTGGTFSDVGGGAGAPAVQVQSTGTLTLNSTQDRTLSNRALVNLGTVNWLNGGRLFVSGGGAVLNDAQFNVQADMQILPGGGAPSLTNQGTITKSGGTGQSLLGIPLTNTVSGTVVANTGVFAFGSVDNSGQLTPAVAPSASPVAVPVNGNFLQRATGSLTLDITGANCATFDQLQVSGTATLAGTLTVATGGGCTNLSQARYVLIAAPQGVVGRFTTTSVPSGYIVGYDQTDVFISVS